MNPVLSAAVNAINDRLVAADSIAKALDLAGDGDPPPWVDVFRDQIEGIRVACESLECLLASTSGYGGTP